MNMPDDLFIQFTAEEFVKLSTEDRLYIHNLKVSPRCNEARHGSCSIEVKSKGKTEDGIELETVNHLHWLHGDGKLGTKRWPWCECTCHVPLAEKQAWMKKNLPSFKNK